MGFWHRLQGFWFGGIDTRVYTITRVVFSITVLICLLKIWPERVSFFTDQGMVHGGRWPEGSGVWHRLSVFSYATTVPAVTFVFCASALAMVFLGLGVMPRLCALLVLYWQISYTVSVPAMRAGWDDLLRNIGLFVAIAPLGRPLVKWGTADTLSSEGSPDESPRYAAVLLQLLLAMIYWQTVWEKVPHGGWQNGELISYFMMSEWSKFPSMVWAEPPMLVVSNFVTYGTLVFEAAIPVLLWRKKTRWLGFACGIALHGGIAVLSPIWIFSLSMMIPYIAFLDGDDLDRLAGLWAKLKRGIRPAAPVVAR
jgi:hypothetical protein